MHNFEAVIIVPNMLFWKIIFIASIFIIIYNYIGYAIIVLLINKLTRKSLPSSNLVFTPSVSFIVAAYNEETFIEEKIVNSLQQNYPSSNIEFIFITDGSTDKTVSIIQEYPVIKLLHSKERKGKSAALNRAIAAASNDILIMSDANTFLNKDAVQYIAAHYASEQVGGVAGEKKVMHSMNDAEDVGKREGLYWKYESFLKKLDSEFYSVVGAAGELFSVRRNLYQPLPDSVILDDFIISLKAAQQGYKIVYEPRAYASELSSVSIKEEKKRKVRIAAGGFQAMRMLLPLLYFWKHPRLTFLYVSHRVLRWTLSPLCLILLFISNIILAFAQASRIFTVLLIFQVLFYAIGFVSKYIPATSKFKFLKIISYFSFMNYSVILGFFRYASKKQSSVWEKAQRSSEIINA